MFTQASQPLAVIEASITVETQPAQAAVAPRPTPLAMSNDFETETDVYPYTPIGFSPEGYVYSPVQFVAY